MRRRHDVHCGRRVGRMVRDMVDGVVPEQPSYVFVVASARPQMLLVLKCLAIHLRCPQEPTSTSTTT